MTVRGRTMYLRHLILETEMSDDRTVDFRNFIVFFGPRPWHIEIRHRVKKTSTINLFGFETLELKVRRLKLWKPPELRLFKQKIAAPPPLHQYRIIIYYLYRNICCIINVENRPYVAESSCAEFTYCNIVCNTISMLADYNVSLAWHRNRKRKAKPLRASRSL